MLKRILEPEVMDSEQEAQEYNDMDHSEVNHKFVQELLDFVKSTSDSAEVEPDLGDVLDLGTGTALIPIELCRQSENCRVMAIHMAVSMLELARYNLEAAGLTERIALSQVDAKGMNFEDGMFTTVISNSIIHHIPEPAKTVSEMARVCEAEGVIFVRDLMRPDDLETLDKIVATYAGHETEYSQKLFRESLHASLNLDEMKELVEQFGFDPKTVTATSDRHWTWAARK